MIMLVTLDLEKETEVSISFSDIYNNYMSLIFLSLKFSTYVFVEDTMN